MALFQDADNGPRSDAAEYADVLSFYGAVGDAACGNPPGFSARKAAAALSIAKIAQLDEPERQAVYYAGLLHAVGALGNAAYRRGEPLSERMARIESWDVPAQGARRCAELEPLPAATADMVRWQAESWDGTGYPDQLRWHATPKSAVALALADAYVSASDPEEALAEVAMQSGRKYSPEMARIFTMWFHLHAGELEPVAVPVGALSLTARNQAQALLDRIADLVDAHNAMPGRWRRLARLCEGTARFLRLSQAESRALAIAARVCGAGEVADVTSSEASFDPLARLGIEERAAHGVAAAELLGGNATLAAAAPILRARGEWYDGTGRPSALLHEAIPAAAGILAAAIAYDSLDNKDRIDTAAGTQFSPAVVRSILEAAKTHA
jgi:response regulator RpfG family c-di-GMP phosphodiesterase